MTRTPRMTRVFVDAIEDDDARVLVGEEPFSIPVAWLPEGIREGEFVELSAVVVPAPPSADDTEERRRRLAKDDPGGDIEL